MAGAALMLAACGALGLQPGLTTPLEPSSVGEAAALQCARATGPLGADATLAGREGTYRLTLVRDGAAGRRTTVSGSLTLERRAADAPPFGAGATPLHGSTDVDLAQVGALRAGDAASEAAVAPGVLVLETDTQGERSILLRLGATANRSGLVRFDGAYTVLDVQAVSDEGFAGAWRSGAMGRSQVNGWFCARTSP